MKNKYIILDTETKTVNGNIYAYAVGFMVVDRYNRIYEQWEFLIKETIQDYKINLDKYVDSPVIIASAKSVKRLLLRLISDYDIKAIIAHNAPHDKTALNNTLGGVDIVPWLCTYRTALKTVCNYKTYPYKTKTGLPSATAENLYRYIKNQDDFIQTHTALDDCMVCYAIYLKEYRSHKCKMVTIE